MKTTITLVFITLIELTAFAADNPEQFKATPLSDTLYMLEGSGGNITASIGPDGVFLVDDDFPEMADKLKDKLRELGGASPRYILNTHFHYDHSGGNEAFGLSATILAASAVRERLRSEQILWKEKHPALPKQAWPAITFDHSLTLHFNGDDVEILHLPNGHTDGDSVAFFPGHKVVSMGDLYFSGMYPIFHPEHDGSLEGYLKNGEEVWRRITPDTKIVPGHGPLSTRAELGRYLAMIRATMARVKMGIRRGKDLKEIQKEGLPKEWDSFSHGYVSTDRWLAEVYGALHP